MNRDQLIIALAETTPQMSKALATKIVDALYAKGLDAKDFDAILWRLRRKMESEELTKLLNAASKETIAALVDDLAALRSPSISAAACCSEGHYLTELQLSEGKVWKAGDVLEDVQILRTGQWKHPIYGKFGFTTQSLAEMEQHFKNNVRGVKLFADEDHDPQHKALAEFQRVYRKGKDKLFAAFKLTAKGAQMLNEGAYKYFSSEFARVYRDIETGKTYRNLLLGGAFTNRPVVKGMQPILASESGTGGAAGGEQATAERSANILLLHSPSEPMLKFFDLLDSLVGKDTITASEKAQFEDLWANLSEEDKALPEYKAKYDDVMALELAEGDDETDDEEDEENDDDAEEGDEPAEGAKDKKDVKASERKNKKPAKKPSKKKAVDVEEPLELSEREELAQLRAEKRRLSERETSIRLSEAEQQVDTIFGDDAQLQLTPKSRKKLAQFAVNLSESQEKKLWEIMGDIEMVMLGEIGLGKDADGDVVLSESHPAVKKLLGAGYELSEAQDIAAEHLKLKRKKKA